MYWHKYNDGRPNGGIWRCREKRKPFDRATGQAYYYERMPATVRIEQSLRRRRAKALKRRRERRQRGT